MLASLLPRAWSLSALFYPLAGEVPDRSAARAWRRTPAACPAYSHRIGHVRTVIRPVWEALW